MYVCVCVGHLAQLAERRLYLIMLIRDGYTVKGDIGYRWSDGQLVDTHSGQSAIDRKC